MSMWTEPMTEHEQRDHIKRRAARGAREALRAMGLPVTSARVPERHQAAPPTPTRTGWRGEVERILHQQRETMRRLTGRDQDKHIIATRRLVASYLAQERGWSLSQVGRFLRRDHSTIINLLRPKGKGWADDARA